MGYRRPHTRRINPTAAVGGTLGGALALLALGGFAFSGQDATDVGGNGARPITASAGQHGGGWIVKAASLRGRGEADAEARRLRSHGITAHVLNSDDYKELRRGWFVVYLGPWAQQSSARAAAGRVKGGIVQHVTTR